MNFIKKSIFPSETLAWTASIRALTYAAISFVILLIFTVAITHGLPLSALLLPLVVVPFILFLLGASWFLMALGSFTRDVAHLMISIVPVLMFATPIFYQISDVPERLRWIVHLNIIGDYVEMIRDVLIQGHAPELDAVCRLAGCLALCVPLRLPLLHAVQIRVRRCHLRRCCPSRRPPPNLCGASHPSRPRR